MYKLFTLAVAVAIIPLPEKITPLAVSMDNSFNRPANISPYKNTITTNPFEPEKKSTEAWNQNWMATAQENIRKSEYNFKWEEKLNAYCTPNRKNNLRFFYDNKGFTVEPRTTKIPIGEFDPMARPDEIKYRTIPNWKIKFNLDKSQVGSGKWQIVNNKAEYLTEKITVQYINSDDGMRQNFIVYSPLSKKDALTIKFSIKTKLKAVLNNNNLEFLHKKNTVLVYEGLKVWDAKGKLLEASIKKNKRNNYAIKVNTSGAVYPITIDPLSTSPSRILESNQANAYFGISVASAGDVNGDGYSDVIIGAHQYDNGETDEGQAFIYNGSAFGIGMIPAAILQCNQAGAWMALSVASAGDVNGDGYSDVIVGAGRFDDGEANEGAVFVYHGSAVGITTAATVLESNQTNAEMGDAVSSAGDINGDGYSDIVVGTPLYDNGHTDEGMVTVYLGSAGGINITPNAIIEGNQTSASMGNDVAAAGDVNGDGYSDIIIGSSAYDNGELNEGIAQVFHGSATGLNSTPAATLESDQANALLGASVACAGDLNGDGYSDIVVGANLYDNGETDEGAVFIHYGSATGINPVVSVTLESDQAGANMGQSAAAAGDVNADGYCDLAVGAFYYNNGQLSEGVVFIYHGSASGIGTTPNTILENNQAHGHFGRCVAAAGDVNGDGYSDLIVGSHLFDNVQSDEGGAFVYHGSAAGLSTTPNNTPDDADQANAAFGYSVASAGDVNGDGYSDVIIGTVAYDDGTNTDEGRAFVYHGSAIGLSAIPNNTFGDANQSNAWFGCSVASAGDVNGDGFSDVIIGASSYNDGVNTDEGKAFVYQGSAGGLSATPNNTVGDANQVAAFFGWSVASAGDVNGDGYSDVIIGAPAYDDGASLDEGKAFVYHGSATGLSATPNNTPDDADNATANLGYSVANAGDVNGDGYSDVIIGAPNYDEGANTNEGWAFLYLGSASGLLATPGSAPDDADQAFAYFGCSVSSAGDVNGDGYSDVVIGAYGYDDGANIEEGRAFVYQGSATGLSASPNNTLGDADQSNAWFGWSVASAGDVNGDGYSDVMIGASDYDDGANINEGRVFIYHGSPTGLSGIPNNTPDDANQDYVRFGASVASAGDVNGDGYSDIIIGAAYFDDGASSVEGRAFLYNGNEQTENKQNNLRLYNTDLTTPINSSNFIFGNFGAGLYAKSFLGRAKGKMVWETRLNYDAYSGTPITNSTFFTAQQAAYTDMGLTGVEFKSIIDKIAGTSRYTKLRARIKYDPVTSITGQVYSPWRNVSSIIDANNLGALPIELISFNAVWLQKGKTARLDFKTDKESGICCFDIEKSLDGFNFYPIGILPAKNTNGIQSYSFIDNNAKNKNQFYRLKIKGVAGKIEYSNIQQLQNNGAIEILVFPNPTTDVLQLQMNNVFDKMNIQIINSAGQLVKQLQLKTVNQTISIPVQNLASGKYWLHLQSGDEKQVLQFVKQ